MVPPFCPLLLVGRNAAAGFGSRRAEPGSAGSWLRFQVISSLLGGCDGGNLKRRSSARSAARAARIDRGRNRALPGAAERDSRGGRQGPPARPFGPPADRAPAPSR